MNISIYLPTIQNIAAFLQVYGPFVFGYFLVSLGASLMRTLFLMDIRREFYGFEPILFGLFWPISAICSLIKFTFTKHRS